MGKRSYRQNCALALTLDAVGDRWTLLILRELLIAPRRYGELLEALPQIGTNLLADRLKQLEADAIVIKVDDPTSAHHAYQLTSAGRALEPALLALIRWGLTYAPKQPAPLTEREHWDLLAARALFRPRRPVPEGDYCLDASPALTATVRHQRLRLIPGTPDAPVATIEADKDTLLKLGRGHIDLDAWMRAHPDRIRGNRTAAGRFLAAFNLGED